ncbi:hypothetical protein SAMN05421823_103406 [Catalinimonas alkaloidigena]|uniref:Heat induced stress protein YflT n=1 Tax=Catalinimonas alkaloidigena TaxID=1075417 RepID=A0A1G9EB05_9BACT|nr:hypothetical protein [Catalinimonas alkaloidigena]SDK73268.1 hypothetical protein SAMN05421823_103406 [Catalinimonas alkaloidigena]
MEDKRKNYPGYTHGEDELRATNEARTNSPESYEDGGMNAQDLQSSTSDGLTANQPMAETGQWKTAPDDLNPARRDQSESEWNERTDDYASREDASLGNQPAHGWDETRNDVNPTSTNRLDDRPGHVVGEGYNPTMSNAAQQSHYAEVAREASREAYEAKDPENTNPVGLHTSAHTEFIAGNNPEPEVFSAIFYNADRAEDAYRQLKNHGYREDEITVVMSKDTRERHYNDDRYHDPETDLGNRSLEGAGAGSAIGGTIGAIVGAIAAVGTSVILPGVGLVIAGPIAAGLAGAGAGGLAGGIIGALAGAGVPEEKAQVYETGIKEEGGILISFKPHGRSDAERFEREFRQIGGEHIHY